MVFFCLSVIHSLANSFANAFFKNNVPRRRQAKIAFPILSDHFLRRLGFRNDAWRRRVLVRLRAKNKCCLLGPRTRRSRKKPDGLGQEKIRRARSSACGCAASERLALEEKPLAGCVRGGACVSATGWGYGIYIYYELLPACYLATISQFPSFSYLVLFSALLPRNFHYFVRTAATCLTKNG